MSSESDQPTKGLDAGDVVALKPLRSISPTMVGASVAAIALLVSVAGELPGAVRFAEIVLIAWNVGVLVFGPLARRKRLRRYLIADRSLARIKALQNVPAGMAGMPAWASFDRTSLHVGYNHAMFLVDGQLRQAVADVDGF